MIHIAIGTKAQFIKMAPIMVELATRKVDFVLQDFGQHKGITPGILDTFSLHDIERNELVRTRQNASSITGILGWSLKILIVLLQGRSAFRNHRTTINKGEYVLVHGDTLSTLFGALLSKRLGAKVVLIEAGLTSRKLLNPFPEEMIRRLVQRLSTICFCPGPNEHLRLSRQYPQKLIINTFYNTGRDAVEQMIRQQCDDIPSQITEISAFESYTLCTIHRFETISSAKSMTRMLDYIRNLAHLQQHIIFCLHEPTERYLRKHALIEQLHSIPNVTVTSLFPYHQFVKLISQASLVVTDGGSIQEECYTLNIPCIIYRDATERSDGIGINALLTTYDEQEDLRLLSLLNQDDAKSQSYSCRATDVIVDALTEPHGRSTSPSD